MYIYSWKGRGQHVFCVQSYLQRVHLLKTHSKRRISETGNAPLQRGSWDNIGQPSQPSFAISLPVASLVTGYAPTA